MAIQVRFFASLRELMGRSEQQISAQGIVMVNDVWRSINQGQPLPENILCAVNMEYADGKASVEDGDEVAFFPPVTGG